MSALRREQLRSLLIERLRPTLEALGVERDEVSALRMRRLSGDDVAAIVREQVDRRAP